MKNFFVGKILVAVLLLTGCILPLHVVFASSTCACYTTEGDCLFANLSTSNDSDTGCAASCASSVPKMKSSDYGSENSADIKAFQCSTKHTNFLVISEAAAKKAASSITGTPEPLPIISPTLSIPVPGMAKWDSSISSGTLSTNFLAVYINGVYSYLIIISITIAVVMVIIGGFQYVLASGSGNVEKGKTRIKNAIVGVVLLLCSYLILRTVNPQLVLLQLVSLQNIPPIDLATLEYDQNTYPTDETVGGSSTAFDAIIQKWAPCAGINWNVLKKIAGYESNFHPNLLNNHCAKVNSNPTANCATGLFQNMPPNCTGSLARYQMTEKCTNPGLLDPEVSTMLGVMLANTSVDHVKKLCPNASERDKAFLVYYGHTSGPGAEAKGITAYGCNTLAWPPNDTTRTIGKTGHEKQIKVYLGATKAYVDSFANSALSNGPVFTSGGSCPFNK